MRYLGEMKGIGQLQLGDTLVPGVKYLIDVFLDLDVKENMALGSIWGDVSHLADRARGALTLRLSDGKTLKVLVEKTQFIRGLTQVTIQGTIPGW